MHPLASPISNKTTSVYIGATCPHCGHVVQLTPSGYAELKVDAVLNDGLRLGFRSCPNKVCRGTVVVLVDASNNPLLLFPPAIIKFDTTGVPEKVVGSLTEAAQCEATGCFRAAAIMIRRTLEELCAANEADGRNLAERLAALSSKVLLPAALIDGLTNLRLLGNDAAHLEAVTYESVGADEIAIAMEVTIAILKSVYQMGELVAKLDALKRA